MNSRSFSVGGTRAEGAAVSAIERPGLGESLTVLRHLIERIDEAYPGLARWLGDRLDLQLPAIGVSVLTHLVLLGTLGMVGYAAHTEINREFRTEVVNT